MAKSESLRNFFALLWQSPEPPVVKRIEVSSDLQHQMTDLFSSQAAEFLESEPKRVHFDGRYRADDSEIFVIDGFPLPAEIVEAVKHPHQLEKLVPDKDELSSIKSVFAAPQGGARSSPTVEFQAFDRSHLLGFRFSILGRKGTFRKLEDTGLTLDTKLAAIYEGGTLIFNSPYLVKKFVDITNYYRLATDEEISEILSHPSISIGEKEKEAFSQTVVAWYRRRFTAIKESGVLETNTPLVISNRAKKFGFEVKVEKGKLIFPNDTKTAKSLVKLLAEEFFEGVFTGRAYQTNSMREIGEKG